CLKVLKEKGVQPYEEDLLRYDPYRERIYIGLFGPGILSTIELFRAWFPKDIDKRGVIIALTTLRLVLIESIGCVPRFCLKALSTPEVIAAMDTTQLGTLIMKLEAANAKATLNVYNEIIKKPGSPHALKALNCCVEAYKYAIL
ncbi:hypothetical protein Gotri_010708, partial [Gossypium trilobum]|nr:hypothetical protein [Gossypium trilobum]